MNINNQKPKNIESIHVPKYTCYVMDVCEVKKGIIEYNLIEKIRNDSTKTIDFFDSKLAVDFSNKSVVEYETKLDGSYPFDFADHPDNWLTYHTANAPVDISRSDNVDFVIKMSTSILPIRILPLEILCWLAEHLIS